MVEWTDEQTALIDAHVPQGDFLIVSAAAGSGKTSCLAEKCRRDASASNKILAISFGKSDTTEFRRAVGENPHVTIRTFDSIVNSVFTKGSIAWETSVWAQAEIVVRNWEEIFADPALQGELPERYFKRKRRRDVSLTLSEYMLGNDIAKIILPIINMHLCKRLLMFGEEQDVATNIERYLGDVDITKYWKKHAAIGMVLLRWTHDILNVKMESVMPEYARAYVASMCKLKGDEWNKQTFPYAMLYVDEAQDLNTNMMEWVLCQKHMAKVLVGDDKQHIFQFMHTENAFLGIDRIASSTWNTKHLSLSKSFRFGPVIAQKINNTFGTRIEGCGKHPGMVVTNCVLEDACSRLYTPEKFTMCILSRSNKNMAKNIERFLGAMTRRKNPFDATQGEMLEWSVMGTADLSKFENEIRKMQAAECDPRKKHFARKTDSLSEDKSSWESWLCKTIGSAQSKTLFETIRQKFVADWKSARVVFSTVHRFKGKEADIVFADETTVWDPSVEDRKDENKNIFYTAITRPVHRLMIEARQQ